MAFDTSRLRFYPVPVGEDLVRANLFEFILPSSSFSDIDTLRIMCRSFNVQLPNSHAVEVQWISGTMQLAGRQQTAYKLQTNFYIGNDSLLGDSGVSHNALKALYEWRNKVQNHKTGFLHAALDYKYNCNINIYDVTGDVCKFKIIAEGFWPSNISDIGLSVEKDGPIELQCTFCADRMDIEEFDAS